MPIHFTDHEISTIAQLKVLRKILGLSQAELAKRADSSLWRVNQIERFVLRPRPDELDRIRRVLSTGESQSEATTRRDAI